MQELELKVWCDMCRSRDKRVPASSTDPIRMVIDGKPHEVDLCEECRGPIQFAYDVGREPELGLSYRKPVRRRKDAPDLDEKCPLCPNVLRRTSLSGHVRNVHGVGLTELRMGTPKHGASAENPGHFPCPHDGCDFIAIAPQGLAAHRRHGHGRTQADISAEREAVQA